MNATSSVFDALDGYLRLLDAAPIAESGMFESQKDKERYETRLMYVFRKYDAARYHLRNVRSHLERDRLDLRPRSPVKMEGAQFEADEATSSITVSAHHYAHELAAFLEALKSAVDFSAAACKPHLDGVELDSIKTLIKLAKSGRAGPVYDAVRKNLAWLERLSEYRHHVVHRLVTPMYMGSATMEVGGIAKTAVTPVAVPRNPPKYVPDTRRSAADNDLPLTKMTRRTEVTSTGPGGRKSRVVDHSVSFGVAPGYAPIEDFMKEHLHSFETYFVSLLTDLERLDFAPARPAATGNGRRSKPFDTHARGS
jgi:hypothetical protein